MLRDLGIFFVIFFMALPTSANINSEYINKHIPNAKKVGNGQLSFLLWNIYEISLYAPNAQYEIDKPLALQLEYKMDLNGQDIADRSIVEIKNQGYRDLKKLSAWKSEMEKIFPNVKNGTILTGVLTDKGTTIFYKNGKKIGEILDKEFGKQFFDIWLGKNTSAPQLRKNLLGMN